MKTSTLAFLVLFFSIIVIAQSSIAIEEYNSKTPTTESNYIFSIVLLTLAVLFTIISGLTFVGAVRMGGLRGVYGNIASDASSSVSSIRDRIRGSI